MKCSVKVAQLVEEPNDLASHVFSPRLLVVHDSGRGCENDVAELTRRQEVDNPFLHVTQLNVVPWANDAGLVDAGGSLVYFDIQATQMVHAHRPFS